MSPIFSIGSSHRLAPAVQLERWSACRQDVLARLLEHREEARVDGAVLLSTCNRLEILVHCPPRWRAVLEEDLRPPRDHVPVQVLEEEAAVRHLLGVAVGLDSMALGEDQILGQVRRAFQTAEHHGLLSPPLRRLGDRIVACAREIRASTGLDRVGMSLSVVAADHVARRGGRCVVFGAGETGRRAAEALARRAVEELVVVNRTYDRAERLARHLKCRAQRREDFLASSERYDGLILALKSPVPVIGPDQARRFATIVDLSMPSVVDPTARSVEGVEFVDLDGLARLAGHHVAQDRASLRSARDLVRRHARHIHRGLAPHRRNLGEVVQLHVDCALSELAQEFQGRLRHLGDRDREALQRFAERLARRHAHFHLRDLREAMSA